MTDILSGIFGLIVLYILVGLFTFTCLPTAEFIMERFKNPLWRFPLTVLWPITLVFMLGEATIEWCDVWLNDVKQYYSEKKEGT